MAQIVNDSNFQEVISTNKIAVIDFWAPWCGPCKILGPIIDTLAENNPDIYVGKINLDENSVIARDFGIRAIPTVLFFKDGEHVDTIGGAKPLSFYQEKIDSLV